MDTSSWGIRRAWLDHAITSVTFNQQSISGRRVDRGSEDVMKQVTVGVGDLFVTRDPSVQLVTYALGTCISVTLYDPVAGVGGMLHFLLPKSSINKDR